MGYSTTSLQNIIDIANLIDTTLKNLELPDGYKLENVGIQLMWKKEYAAKLTLQPHTQYSEPHINTNVVG